MKQYKKFVKDYLQDDGLGFIEEDVDTLIKHMDVDDDTGDNLQLESLSSVVSAVAGGIAIKSKSLLGKLKSEKDGFRKQDILGQMILLSTYGSMVGAAASVKNQSVLRKLTGRKMK
jgi:hypothetical protein